MKVALVYDRLNKWGGAERLLLALNEIFPNAPCYTSVYDAFGAKWARVFPKIVTTFLDKLKVIRRRHEYFPLFMPVAFESLNFDNFDLVISITSEASKGIITKPGTLHICYCLTPTRYLWNLSDFYFPDRVMKILLRPILVYLRKWDFIASRRPDYIISISNEVMKRVKLYYNRDSEVIYPPITINNTSTKALTRLFKKNYFLVVSRLVKYKRVDLAIKVFNKLKKYLVIIGVGSEGKNLKKMAQKNIIFKGQLTDDKLCSYYQYAEALIFPQEEDFGLVAVEANYFGTPVIAYKKAGVTEIIREEKSGIFFNEQNEDSLVEAIKRFKKIKFDKQVIKKNAQRFKLGKFKKDFVKYLKRCQTGSIRNIYMR